MNAVPDWKDTMFRCHALEFAQILAARRAAIDPSWLRSVLPAPPQRLAILDLGCGTGRLLAPLAELGTQVVGLDYSAELLGVAADQACTLAHGVLVQGDMRHLRALFPDAQFQLIVRAYTSLGYFDRATEGAILRDCHAISSPGARLVVDTFNADWFKAHPLVERCAPIGGFSLHETYRWNHTRHSVECLWRYVAGQDTLAEIPFELEGYDLAELDALLGQAGWERERLIKDIACFDAVAASADLERLVVVARKTGPSAGR